MRKYHHVGIPTTISRENEAYLEEFKMYVSGYESSPYGVEWMRFEPDSLLPELIKTIPHVAFEVDDLEKEIQNKEESLPTARLMALSWRSSQTTVLPSNSSKSKKLLNDLLLHFF